MKALNFPLALQRSKNRSKRSHLYLGGQVPMDWFYRAMGLNGKALHVALELAFLSKVKRTTEFSFSANSLRHAGINRYAVYRAIDELVRNGLIEASRKRGRKTIININFPKLAQKPCQHNLTLGAKE